MIDPAEEAMAILARKIKPERLWEVLNRPYMGRPSLLQALQTNPELVLFDLENAFDWSATA